MRDGFKVIDSDGHLMPPVTLWQDYLDPRFRDRVIVADGRILVDGAETISLPPSALEAIHFTPTEIAERYGDLAQRGFDPEAVVEALDVEGIDVSVTYDPLYQMWIDGMDPVLAVEMARAYYRWVCDFGAKTNRRVIGAAPVPLHDPDLAVALVDDAWNMGMRAFWVRPNPVAGRVLGDPAYDRLFSALAERNAPLSVHEGMGALLPAAGRDRFGSTSFLEWHACVHPMEQQMALLAMISRGAFDRHPTLRVAFMESGCSWLPYWLWRLDEHVELCGWKEAPTLQLQPTEYFQRQCFISCEPDEHLLAHVIDTLGDDRIVFASDFPHPDSKYPNTVATFLALPGITDESRRKILFDNAVALYQFDPSTNPAFARDSQRA